MLCDDENPDSYPEFSQFWVSAQSLAKSVTALFVFVETSMFRGPLNENCSPCVLAAGDLSHLCSLLVPRTIFLPFCIPRCMVVRYNFLRCFFCASAELHGWLLYATASNLVCNFTLLPSALFLLFRDVRTCRNLRSLHVDFNCSAPKLRLVAHFDWLCCRGITKPLNTCRVSCVEHCTCRPPVGTVLFQENACLKLNVAIWLY